MNKCKEKIILTFILQLLNPLGFKLQFTVIFLSFQMPTIFEHSHDFCKKKLI